MRTISIKEAPREQRLTGVRSAHLLALVAAFAMLGAAPVAASDLCGTTITADLTLDHDLTCPGNALTVGADNVTIRLNGHTISGPGCPVPPLCPDALACPASVGIT